MQAVRIPVQGAQRPAGAPHWTQPPLKQMQREREQGGRHGAKKWEMEWVAGRRGNLASESSRVRNGKESPEASGVEENSWGDCQGVGGGLDLPRGTNTPRVEELPRGGKISRVTLEADGVLGAD